MLGHDGTANYLGVPRLSQIVAVRWVCAVIRAAFEQGFQGSRRVGMVSG